VTTEVERPAGVAASEKPWYTEVTRYQWLVLLISSLGWIFDQFEAQIFPASEKLALGDLTKGISSGDLAFESHIILAIFLCGGALGGILFGMLSDKIGRSKTMIYTILAYSAFTCVSSLVTSWQQLAVMRFLVALGVGGEWAVASALLAEVFPPHLRARSAAIFHASSIIGVLAAVAAGSLIPLVGWRITYAFGALPALLTIWVRMSIREPENWRQARETANRDQSQAVGRIRDLFGRGIVRSTLVGWGLATIGLATYWGVYLYGKDLLGQANVRSHKAAIADEPTPEAREQFQKDTEHYGSMLGFTLSALGTGGGLLAFGPICERFGRRRAFLWFHVLGFACSLILFQLLAEASPWVIATFLLVFGFFTVGMHAGYAVYFPELFPTRMRGTGAGFCFNAGRLVAAPILVFKGYLQHAGVSLEQAATLLSLLFLLGPVLLIWAPETKGKELLQ
jgi:MFS family permease